MRNTLLSALAFAVLWFSNSEALAQKGYSAGNKSYSSGKPPAPSIKPSSPPPSIKPPAPAPSIKPSISPPKPATPAPKQPSISIKPSGNTPAPAPSKGYSANGKSYSSGNKAPPAKPGYTESSKPKDTFQSLPATEQKKAEARAAYQKAIAPKETYKNPKGEEKKIDTNDKRVQQVRNMDEQKWVNRESRAKDVYNIYYSRPPIYYDDYNPWFWYWLLDRSFDERAMWAYAHRNDVNSEMYRALMAHDTKLAARVKQLEDEKKSVDPDYIPDGIDPDLQYDDSFVDAAVNPTEKPMSAGDFFYGIWIFIKWVACIGFVGILMLVAAWVIFYKRW